MRWMIASLVAVLVAGSSPSGLASSGTHKKRSGPPAWEQRIQEAGRALDSDQVPFARKSAIIFETILPAVTTHAPRDSRHRLKVPSGSSLAVALEKAAKVWPKMPDMSYLDGLQRCADFVEILSDFQLGSPTESAIQIQLDKVAQQYRTWLEQEIDLIEQTVALLAKRVDSETEHPLTSYQVISHRHMTELHVKRIRGHLEVLDRILPGQGPDRDEMQIRAGKILADLVGLKERMASR